jgi:predicted MPP superfamily phosphohydrolase
MRNPLAFLIFLVVVLVISGLIHLFLYRGLVRGLSITSPTALWPLRATAVLLAVSYPLARWMDQWAPEGPLVAAHWIASLWMGLMFHLLWLGLAFFLLKMLLVVTGLWSRLEPAHASLGRSAVLTVTVLALVLCGFGIRHAFGPVRVRTAEIPVKGLTKELSRLRIVLVADFHAGVVSGERSLHRWVEAIQAQSPDLILIPGDIVDHPPERLPGAARALRKLVAPLGVFASTGNHEYIVGVEKSVAFLEKCGIRVLRNESRELPVGLVLAGIEDASAPSFGGDVPPVAEVLGPEVGAKPTILLHHTPGTRQTRRAAEAGADLMVSGHTHGGQIWPFGYLTRAVFPYHHGLYEVEGRRQLTTCGIGFWGPPMRFRADPELWVIRLIERPAVN